MAAGKPRTYTVQVTFLVTPTDPEVNTGHMVDALMAMLDDLDTAGVEPEFRINSARWQRTTITEVAR